MLERFFESFLWNTRFIVLLAVFSSLVGSILLFLLATFDMAGLIGLFVDHFFFGHEHVGFHTEVVSHIIQAVDDFLLATVLLIFALGLYELFISKIDVAHAQGAASNVLIINTLDDLKDRLGKVVLMILVVVFFKNVLHVSFENPLNILYLGAGITLVALALYLTHKSGSKH
ncbi:MAG: YqhA family protein [Mariprofundaceae bacterium]